MVNATTAAQYFHVLRRQMHREVRKPLVVFTPKSLLRSPAAISPVEELVAGHFHEVLDDPAMVAGERERDPVSTVLVASGKVAHELLQERDRRDLPVAVIRAEQLYPFPDEQLAAVLASYPHAEDVCWVQEEPANMGGWGFVGGRLCSVLGQLGDGRGLRRASRAASASPAAGQHVVHEQEQSQLLEDALGPVTD